MLHALQNDNWRQAWLTGVNGPERASLNNIMRCKTLDKAKEHENVG